MGKILLLALGVWLLLTILNKYRRSLDAAPPPAETHIVKSDDMVRCEQCGVHVPVKESVLRDGKHYCSEAHAMPDQP